MTYQCLQGGPSPQASAAVRVKSVCAQEVFDQRRWEQHRTSSRYLRHLTHLLLSPVVRRTLLPCLFTTLVALLVAACNQWYRPLGISAEVHTLCGFSISLLLAFRTNASYERFREGRVLWGSITNCSRTWAALAAAYMPSSMHDSARAHISLFCIALKARLLPQASQSTSSMLQLQARTTQRQSMMGDMEEGMTIGREADVEGGLDEGPSTADGVTSGTRPEINELLVTAAALDLVPQSARPWHVVRALVALMAEAGGQLPCSVQMRMHESLSGLTDAWGGCERLLSTPIPLSYTRHTSRCLMLWLLTLPLVLWPVMGWASLAAVWATSFILIGIDEIGVQIEDPFAILALAPICDGIQLDVVAAFDAAAHGPNSTTLHHANM